MGEVLAGVIVLVVVVVVLTGVIAGLVNYAKANQPEAKSPDYRNHLAMARWIEHALHDDMERACTPEGRQQAARKLLAAFYDEEESKWQVD